MEVKFDEEFDCIFIFDWLIVKDFKLLDWREFVDLKVLNVLEVFVFIVFEILILLLKVLEIFIVFDWLNLLNEFWFLEEIFLLVIFWLDLLLEIWNFDNDWRLMKEVFYGVVVCVVVVGCCVVGGGVCVVGGNGVFVVGGRVGWGVRGWIIGFEGCLIWIFFFEEFVIWICFVDVDCLILDDDIDDEDGVEIDDEELEDVGDNFVLFML